MHALLYDLIIQLKMQGISLFKIINCYQLSSILKIFILALHFTLTMTFYHYDRTEFIDIHVDILQRKTVKLN